LAEDNPVVATVIAQQLTALGYACTVAPDGESAWEILRGGEFVALLTDCEMPILDGYALTARLRATPAYADLPVIALSARPDAAQLARCRAAGMDACLTKPISNAALAQVLAQPRKGHSSDGTADSGRSGLAALQALYPEPRSLAAVLTLFVSMARVDLPKLQALYQRDAIAPFGKVAHRLVGSLQLLGEHALAEQLTRWYRSEALPSPAQYAHLHAQLTAIVDQVEAWAQQLKRSKSP
jgi:two-component system sensor histidine kinase EvgS